MRLIFCGTPEFAVPSLRAVLAAGHEVALVIAQPDRPVGRKQILTAPAVKQFAVAAGLPVAQPTKVRNNPEFESALRQIAPEAIIVVAYGRIIPPWMLNLPRLGNINVHGSLLPRYRGAAPIQWAIANGEKETGVTTMLLDEGLDTGPTLGHRSLAIAENETAEEFSPRLAALGAALLIETLTGLENGSLTPQPQDNAHASLARILTREDGRVDFTRPAQEIYNRWRGFQPWPGAFAEFRGERFSLVCMQPANTPSSAQPGALSFTGNRLYVTAGDQMQIELLEVQPAGSRVMIAAQFLSGARLQANERLS